MQIIDELEPTRRGPYAGAVGYIDFSGNMDTCIALRTMITPGEVFGRNTPGEVHAPPCCIATSQEKDRPAIQRPTCQTGAIKPNE